MLRFERECRTPYSEVYTIYDDEQPQGRFDVHFSDRIIHATLCVTERYTTDEIQDIIEDINDEVLNAIGLVRDELVVHVHQGRDLGVFSSNDDAEELSPGADN